MTERRPGGRLRRAVAPAALCLGACLLTIAVLLVAVLVPAQSKTPLDVVTTISCEGRGDVLDAATLDSDRLRVDRDVPITYRQRTAVQEPSDADRVTVEIATSILRDDRPEKEGLVSAMLHRVTADRRTAMPEGDGINGSVATEQDMPSTPVHVDGLEVKWPFDAQRQSYPFYDSTARASQPIDYVDSGPVEGASGSVDAYHYHQKLDPVDLSKVDPNAVMQLPAGALGLPGTGNVRVKMYYPVDRDYYVEPRTGTVVDAVERIHQYLGRSASDELVTAFRFDAELDRESVDEQTGVALDALHRLHLWGVVMPSVLAVIGALLLVGGLVDGVRRHRRAPAPTENVGMGG